MTASLYELHPEVEFLHWKRLALRCVCAGVSAQCRAEVGEEEEEKCTVVVNDIKRFSISCAGYHKVFENFFCCC